jgi:hypothetical protein
VNITIVVIFHQYLPKNLEYYLSYFGRVSLITLRSTLEPWRAWSRENQGVHYFKSFMAPSSENFRKTEAFQSNYDGIEEWLGVGARN